jgi:N-acetylglucosamine malate deacetylase 2
MKELDAKLAAKDPESMKWVRYERFFSYKWEQDFE